MRPLFMFVCFTKRTKVLVCVHSFIIRTDTNELPAERFINCLLKVQFVCNLIFIYKIFASSTIIYLYFVLEELNVKSVVPCNDPLKYASLRAEPDFSVLGRRLGKSMKVVADAKAMSHEGILSFENIGEITIANHILKLSDIKIVRGFKRPDGMAEEQMDATGDGDVLVIIDMQRDDSLLEAGFAREYGWDRYSTRIENTGTEFEQN
ncbi:putative isoleucine--tRNA ligase [Helianthus anomalus]